MNENWPRWIESSCILHFLAHTDLVSFAEWPNDKTKVPLFIEGENIEINDSPRRLEFRLMGPDINEVSRNVYEIDFEINILVMTAIPQNGEDFYREKNAQGIVLNRFTGGIPFRLCGSSADNDTQIGCFERVGKVDIQNFGQIHKDKQIKQSTVQAKFTTTIEV